MDQRSNAFKTSQGFAECFLAIEHFCFQISFSFLANFLIAPRLYLLLYVLFFHLYNNLYRPILLNWWIYIWLDLIFFDLIWFFILDLIWVDFILLMHLSSLCGLLFVISNVKSNASFYLLSIVNVLLYFYYLKIIILFVCLHSFILTLIIVHDNKQQHLIPTITSYPP